MICDWIVNYRTPQGVLGAAHLSAYSRGDCIARFAIEHPGREIITISGGRAGHERHSVGQWRAQSLSRSAT